MAFRGGFDRKVEEGEDIGGMPPPTTAREEGVTGVATNVPARLWGEFVVPSLFDPRTYVRGYNKS
jgi:hypothetical protein